VRIIVVDDTAVTRLLLTNLLNAMGYDVVDNAQDGMDAIVKCKKWKPDVVLLDITMPGMDGLTAIPRLLENDPNLKIVICSALAQKDMVVEAIKKGAVNYMVKPITKETLEKIMKTLEESSAQ